MNKERRLSMDEVCDLSRLIVSDICHRFNIKEEQVYENEDIRYTDKAQDIFNSTLDIIDDYFNN